MKSSGSFQKTLIVVNALFTGAYILAGVILQWPEGYDFGGIMIALLSLGISLMYLLLDWLDKKFLPIDEMNKADKEAREWKQYLKEIKKELLSDKNSS